MALTELAPRQSRAPRVRARVMGARRMRLTIPALVFAGATAARGAGALPVERPHDPVVLSTGSLEGVGDRDPNHYRLYAVRDGGLIPVPFQVDARDGNGAYELGSTTGVGSRFDDDDELVFMAKDLGTRQEGKRFPGPVVELEVSDADTGSR